MAINADTLKTTNRNRRATPDGSELTPTLRTIHPWGIRAKPGKRGLTFDEIEIGEAASSQSSRITAPFASAAPCPGRTLRESPAATPARPMTAPKTRASLRRGGHSSVVLRHGHSVGGLEPLPDDIERAMCQLCTFLTEVEFIAGDTPAQWLGTINSEHHEVKLFLLSQIMDEARHLDVFRKRAFANGGGLLSSLPQDGLRVIIEAKDFTEMSASCTSPRRASCSRCSVWASTSARTTPRSRSSASASGTSLATSGLASSI